MSIFFYIAVWAFAVSFALILHRAAEGNKDKGVSIQKGPALQKEERDPDGERVRAIIFDAYKDMKKHTPSLDLLTACLTQSMVSKDTAIFALDKTLERLEGRYNTKPVERALNALKSL